jgi:hypothetical protein
MDVHPPALPDVPGTRFDCPASRGKAAVRMHKHLIRPHAVQDRPVDAKSYLAELSAAHDAIVARAAGWTAPAVGPRWGITAKRQLVDLTGAHPSVHNASHPIQELMNQCATVERLLDALEWAIGKGWANMVIECNPTTSSGPVRPLAVVTGVPPSGPPDLRTTGALGEAWFEVSDVLKRRDGNRKLQKDLKRLSNLPPSVAGFLVGSDLWEDRIAHSGRAYEKVRNTLIARV